MASRVLGWTCILFGHKLQVIRYSFLVQFIPTNNRNVETVEKFLLEFAICSGNDINICSIDGFLFKVLPATIL